MITIFFRHHNGNLGKIEVSTENHEEAIQMVQDHLKSEWKKPPHPVLALIKGKE